MRANEKIKHLEKQLAIYKKALKTHINGFVSRSKKAIADIVCENCDEYYCEATIGQLTKCITLTSLRDAKKEIEREVEND